MSLSPLLSFKSRFVTYLLNFPRNTDHEERWQTDAHVHLLLVFFSLPVTSKIIRVCVWYIHFGTFCGTVQKPAHKTTWFTRWPLAETHFCGLFYGAVSNSSYMALNGSMNYELQGISNEVFLVQSIFLFRSRVAPLRRHKLNVTVT